MKRNPQMCEGGQFTVIGRSNPAARDLAWGGHGRPAVSMTFEPMRPCNVIVLTTSVAQWLGPTALVVPGSIPGLRQNLSLGFLKKEVLSVKPEVLKLAVL